MLNEKDAITFGKYKGKTIEDISEIDFSYIVWLNDNNVLQIEKRIVDDCRYLKLIYETPDFQND